MTRLTKEITITGVRSYWHNGEAGFLPEVQRVTLRRDVSDQLTVPLSDGERIIPMSNQVAVRVYRIGEDRLGRPIPSMLGNLFVDPRFLLG